MLKENPDVKLYYKINEVAKMFNVNQSLIRYWETEFDILKPHRNKKGTRYFTKEDIDSFHLLFYLIKEKGMTIPGVKKKLLENKNDVINNFEVIKKLTAIKQELLEIKENIN